MKKQVLLALSLLGCLSLGAQRLVIPNLPDDNITGVFCESPMTWQHQKISEESYSLTAYQIAWNTAQNQWGDTVACVEQTKTTSLSGSQRFTELLWTKNPLGQWSKSGLTEVFNAPNWEMDKKPVPDSMHQYQWDKSKGGWLIQKKILFLKDSSGNPLKRSVFIKNPAQADTIEAFYLDKFWNTLWRERKVFQPQSTDYFIIDSSSFFFPNYAFLASYVIKKNENGAQKPYRRGVFEYVIPTETYDLNIDRWSDTLGFWQRLERITNQLDSTNFLHLRDYTQRTPVSYKLTKRLKNQYDSNWQPFQFTTGFYSLISDTPDSTIQKDYIKDDSTGLIRTIVEQFKPKYQQFQNRTKWEFAPGKKESVSAPEPVSAAVLPLRVSRLSAQSFQLDFDADPAIQSCHLRLFDVSGRSLKDWQEANRSSVSVDLSAFSAGMYYLHVTTGRGSRAVPLVVTE